MVERGHALGSRVRGHARARRSRSLGGLQYVPFDGPGAAFLSGVRQSSDLRSGSRAVVIAQSTERTTKECTQHGGGKCPFVEITTTGFTGTYSCHIFDDANGEWGAHDFTGDLKAEKYWYYGFAQDVWVICDGVKSNTLAW